MNPLLRFCGKNIPFPKKIIIELPFDKASTETERRAIMEEQVDFLQDAAAAKLCTLSYAASELSRYLRRIGKTSITYAQQKTEQNSIQKDPHVALWNGESFVISLSCGDAPKLENSYTIAPAENGISLYGKGRVGTLYAVFSFLNAQGIRWYYPGNDGEIIPENKQTLYVPTQKTDFSPAMKDGRGLDVFSPMKDSEEFLLWMARNRMNITADHPYSNALADKLGMTFRIGGHMFEPFLDPDLPLKDGKTIWELHPEWYGLPPDGERKKERCLKNQFCVSRPDLVDYLANILVNRLRGPWKHVDRLDIWGFDNGHGSSCQCEDCKKIGNDSDRAIYFLSELRSRLDAVPDLRPVSLVACAYEGTKTMNPPTKPIPQNLKARDYVVCYPIHRCYAHDFDDQSCPTNSVYQKQILPWLNQENHLPMIMGEYYNVSKYEDLPLVFSKRIAHEIPVYVQWGFTSMTYMHPPIYNWGVRAVNHMLMAELSWNPQADSTTLLYGYFHDLYGTHAEELEMIYDLVEKAGIHIGNYRNWWFSVLDSLLQWEGARPTKDLDLTGHFIDEEDLLQNLHSESDDRKKALQALEKVIAEVKREPLPYTNTADATTPDQLAKVLHGSVLQNRLLELRRSLIYGADELRLFTLVVEEYVEAKKDKSDRGRWEEIESLYDKMAGYFFPHKYISRKVEAYCEDGLTRSQLRLIIDRRRQWKIENGQW